MFFLELKGNPNFEGILNWIPQILHYSSQEWTKKFLNHKVLCEEKKDWIVTKEENHSYRKKFQAKSDKKQKISFCTPVRKFQKTWTSATKQNRFNKKKTKKKLLRKDTLRVSKAVIRKYCVKKVSLKILPPVYLHIIKTDIR